MKTLLFILVAALLVSCSSKSGKKVQQMSIEKPKVDYIPSYTLQVVHDNGYVENIRDKKNIRPAIGDTLVLHDYGSIRNDSLAYSDRVLWGYYRGDELMPIGFMTDSSWSEYCRVVVIKN